MTSSMLLIQPLYANATHITLPDQLIPRPHVPGEGYLTFIDSLLFGSGDERTGWTDVRHPALDGTVDNTRGFDWSDFQVTVRTHTVADPTGEPFVIPTRIRRDFNVANAAYAQAGITIRHEGGNFRFNGNDIVSQPVTQPGFPPGTMTVEPSLSQLFGTQRSPNANTVNQYYVDDIPGSAGYALPPIYASRGGFEFGGNNTNPLPPGTPSFNSGFAVADNRRNDTFAHELGHMLLDNHGFTTFGDDRFHSSRSDDLMAPGARNGMPFRIVPSADVAKDGTDTFGLRDPGRRNGNIGTTSHLGESVTPLGGAAAISQITAMHDSPFVSHLDHGATFGDRADFDWVEDNFFLENQGKADNHPGFDFLVWRIGGAFTSLHPGHDHGGWGELDLPDFTGPFFHTIDIISQIGRYVDMDVRDREWSARESALDYFVQVSQDGRNWQNALPINVFQPGWTDASDAENWVARFTTTLDARFVLIGAASGFGHDLNTQIDAVIALPVSAIPEPSTLMLFGIGVLGLLCWRRRRG